MNYIQEPIMWIEGNNGFVNIKNVCRIEMRVLIAGKNMQLDQALKDYRYNDAATLTLMAVDIQGGETSLLTTTSNLGSIAKISKDYLIQHKILCN